MIPIRLSVRNFMCYRDNVSPIEFGSFRVACLSGSNGHGKSALLDAITWVLWGKTRAKSDDELIHIGQTEMEVEFEFQLGEHVYRVIRKRKRPKSGRGAGQTELQLNLLLDGEYQAITANSVRDTERKIVDLLKMEYDTFINSVFLVQGRADEFTKRAPGERKQILADILGLGYYDDLERKARDRVKEIAAEYQELQFEATRIESETAFKEQYDADLAEIQDQIKRLEAVARERDARRRELRSRRELYDLKQQLLTKAEHQIDQAQGRLVSLVPQLTDLKRRLSELEALRHEGPAIREGYSRLSELRARQDDIAKRQSRLVALQTSRHSLERNVERAKAELTQRLSILDRDIQQAVQLLESRPRLEAEREQVKKELDACAQLELLNSNRRQEVYEYTTRIEALKTENAKLKAEMQELRDKIEFLKQSDSVCPLCETDLGHAGRHRIESKYQSEGLNKKEQFRKNEQEAQRLARQVDLVHRQLIEDETKLGKNRRHFEGRAAVLDQELERATQAEAQVETFRSERDRIAAQIRDGTFAADDQRSLLEIDQQIAGVGLVAGEADEVQRLVAEHLVFEERFRALTIAEQSIEGTREHLANLESLIGQAEESLADGTKRRDELKGELEGFADIRTSLNEAEREYEEVARSLMQAHAREGAIKQQLSAIEALERRRQELLQEIKQRAEQRSIYEELALAFSKRGVQAMIIESALPEIEAAANEILGRMTDNRMHIAFETQRETRRGDPIETLDIRIADELGTRDYAMFSGGEAYRVNFAIRVALAKVLARRAGAELQTLVIDEGFGTQDATGREKLVEAITSIQDDFDKILVVTHIEELKDVFPTRIDVVKTPEGSIVQVA